MPIESERLGIFFGLSSDFFVIFEVVLEEGMLIELFLVVEVVHVGVFEGVILVKSGWFDSVSSHLEPGLPDPGVVFQDLGVKVKGQDQVILRFEDVIRGAEFLRQVFQFGS